MIVTVFSLVRLTNSSDHEFVSTQNTCYRRKWIHRYIKTVSCFVVSYFILGSAVCKAALARGIQVTSIRYLFRMVGFI